MSQARDSFGSVSVVIPAYNAERDVVATLDSVQGWLAGAAGLPHEIIVVDDASSDRTAEIVERRGRGVRLFRNETNRGKGFSVRRGMLETTLDWALFMDVDNSTTIDHLDRFAPLAATSDVIIASRRSEGSRIVRRQPPIRRLMGRSFPFLVHAIALPHLHDTQCGFKAFRREAAKAIFPLQRIERFAFDVEILLLARRLGYRIAEAPVDWDNPTVSTVRIRADTIKMFLDVVGASWRCAGSSSNRATTKNAAG